MLDPVSPLTIRIMLDCYCTADPTLTTYWGSDAGRQVQSWLRVNDLIDYSNQPTDKGREWVRIICGTPQPIEKWIDPRLWAEVKDA